MEDFQLDIVLGKGPAARSIRLDLPRFTLVGATTRTGLITGPLRDRFGLVARLDFYTSADLDALGNLKSDAYRVRAFDVNRQLRNVDKIFARVFESKG